MERVKLLADLGPVIMMDKHVDKVRVDTHMDNARLASVSSLEEGLQTCLPI